MDTITDKLQSHFDQAPPYIQDYILSDELDTAITLIGKIHKLPVSAFLPLKNIVTFVLIGAVQPEETVAQIQKNCDVEANEAATIAKDVDQAIFEKVRVSVLGKKTEGVKQITLSDGKEAAKIELRKELLDTTKQNDPVATVLDTVAPEPKKGADGVTLTPGSRSQLLEQLHVLETIPNDEEVETRLNHIKEQIATLESRKVTRDLETPVALESFMFGDKGDTVVDAQEKAATYSRAPTAYNVDPYRELATDN